MKKIYLAVCLVLAVFLSACVTTVDNNSRTVTHLVNHIMENTSAVYLCSMEPGIVHAESGASVMYAERQVAFYKYDVRKKKMKKWLDYVNENGYIYMAGIKKPAMASGSFIMVDYMDYPEKTRKKLVDAFKSFK